METRTGERMRSIFSMNLRRRMQDLKMSQSDLARAIWKETRPDSRTAISSRSTRTASRPG